MNVIAIYSTPQECGDDSLRLVSCADGQVVFEIILSQDRNDYVEWKVERTLLSPVGVFYDLCAMQRFDIEDKRDDFHKIFGTFEDKECKVHLRNYKDKFWKNHCDDELTVLSCEKLDVRKHIKGKPIYAWKYTVAVTKEEYETIYHPEKDEVFQNIKKRCGIECPVNERYDIQTLALRISEALGYKMLNLIYG